MFKHYLSQNQSIDYILEDEFARVVILTIKIWALYATY